uniref:Uncharacterized protein n=1 Tax=Anguilla anguilla TaxID=7936 RepID=A0A0E9U166_ANGAN
MFLLNCHSQQVRAVKGEGEYQCVSEFSELVRKPVVDKDILLQQKCTADKSNLV